MKSIKFFAAALAATALMASCAKDGNQSNQEGAPTHAGISISLKSDGAATRATQAGNAAESDITSVTVYVIDNATGRLDTKTFAGTDFATDSGNPGYKKANAAIPTTVGNKTVYVVANAPSALDGMLTSVLAITTNSLALDETNYYTGTSYDGTHGTLTSVVLSGKSPSTTIGAQDATAALATPVQVDLTRNVAKIVVKDNATPITATKSGDGISNLRFALAAKAKSSYLIGQTNTALYAAGNSAPAAGSAYWGNFSARTGLSYTDVNPSGTAATAANAWFALEHKPNYFYEGNTTQIVVEAVYTPKNLVTGYASGVLTEVSNNTTAGDFYVHKATGKAWNATAYAAATTTNGSGYATTDFSDAYTGGKSYYRIPVKEGQGGAKGVVRNHYYEMTISAITGFGSTKEDGDTGTTSVTPILDESNIAATIKVLDWDFVQWNEILQ